MKKKATRKSARKHLSASAWTKLGHGIQIQRHWEANDPKWPQKATLLLTEAEYAKFEADARGYLNEHHVFPVDVNSVFIGHTPPFRQAFGMSGSKMLVVCFHDPGSTSFALSSEAAE